MKFVQTSMEYEQYVRDIQQALLNAQKLETVKALHDVDLVGNSGQAHQIDVYWEYRLAGLTHKVALECKLRGRKVDLGIVRDFWGVVDDIPGLRGVIVSPTGFTSGAIQYAQNKGIGLKIVRPANQEDYHGRIKTILISFRLKQAVNLRLQTNIDTAWYEKNKTLQLEEFLASMNVGKIRTDGIIIEDRNSGEVIILAELQNHLPVLAVEDISATHTWTKTFRDGYIIYPNGYELKLSGIEVDYEIQQSEPFTVVVGGEEVAHVLIQDALAGTLLFVDEQGLISGDTEKEGILKPRASEE